MIGTFRLSRQYLEALRRKGQWLSIRVIGILAIGEDVSVELIDAVVAKAEVHGRIQGQQDVVEAIKRKGERIR